MPVPDVVPRVSGDLVPRRVYIRKEVELTRFGYTEGCPGCVAVATNEAPKGHNAECAARIVEAMAKDPESRQRLAEADVRAKQGPRSKAAKVRAANK